MTVVYTENLSEYVVMGSSDFFTNNINFASKLFGRFPYTNWINNNNNKKIAVIAREITSFFLIKTLLNIELQHNSYSKEQHFSLFLIVCV